MKFFLSLPVFALILLQSFNVYAKGICKQQARDILTELRKIRQLLESKHQPHWLSHNKEQPITVETDSVVSVGRQGTPVVPVEYIDIACAISKPSFHRSKASLSQQVNCVISQNIFPSASHQRAFRAAHTTLRAGDQNKCWKMREVGLEYQAMLEADDLDAYANKIVLDSLLNEECTKRQ
jgi:hypothetical protein